jgi:5-methylcytosine-specific restriction protein A
MQAGLMVPATEVHHIVPVETQHSVPDMERMMYNVSNLEPLCHDCHVRRHKELRSKSKDVIKERERVKLERFREKFC